MLMTSSAMRNILFNPIAKIALPESMVVHTIKWFLQVMKHPGEKKFTWDVEPMSTSSQALVSDWYGKKLPLILTPPTGNIIFKTSGLLESCRVKVNGRQVEFNALTCIDKGSELAEPISKQYIMCQEHWCMIISNNTYCTRLCHWLNQHTVVKV